MVCCILLITDAIDDRAITIIFIQFLHLHLLISNEMLCHHTIINYLISIIVTHTCPTSTLLCHCFSLDIEGET